MQTLPLLQRLRRIVLFSAFLIVSFAVLFSTIASAQQPSPPTVQVVKSQAEREKDQLTRIYVAQSFLRHTLEDLTCHLIGVSRTDATQRCLVEDGATGNLRPLTQTEITAEGYQKGGLIAFGGDAISALYNKPADAGEYTRILVSDFGITKKSYASGVGVNCLEKPEDINCSSGTGFQSLSMILNVFLLFRNLAYLLLVGAFAIVGLAIMLRFHIDPRTVMTIQNQIPKAIIAILLITFSYSIAGVLIDAMWTATYFGINVVAGAQDTANCAVSIGDPANPQTSARQISPGGAATSGILNHPLQFASDLLGAKTGCFGRFDGLSGLALHVGGAFADLLSRLLLTAVGGDEYIPPCGIGLPGQSGDFGGCIQTAIFQLAKFLIGIVAVVVVLVALIISLFRLWFMLLKNYIMLLIDIILGPIYILAGLIPGSKFNFSSWLRSIVAQLAVFPAAAILLVLGSVVASDANINNPTADVFLPPLIGNPNIADALGAIIAFGFILMAPTLLDQLRDALQAPESKQAGAVTTGLAFATGRLTGAAKDAGERIINRDKVELDRPGQPVRGIFRIPIINKRIGA